MDEYYEKYLKYKKKYEILKYKIHHDNKINLLGGAKINKPIPIKTKFECYPENKFADICKEKPNGKYKSKEGCVNDCETKYINNELTKIKIKQETIPFYLFIKDIIDNENLNVYLKGGNVLGLKVLKMIYEKYKNDDKKFKKAFEKFLTLELVKDWDFSAYTQNDKQITEEYREQLDKIARKYKLYPRAKTFVLYQTKVPMLLEDKPLFEISVVDSDGFSKLEVPLTTMKIPINQFNLKYVFMFCASFYAYKEKGVPFDFDILKRMLEKIDIIIHPHKKGLYDVINNFDGGKLNDSMISFVNEFKTIDKNLPQFLATHIEDPFRILYRLIEKNIKKNDKIKDFLKDELGINSKSQEWLFDSKWINSNVKLFCEKLGNKFLAIYKKSFEVDKDQLKAIGKVDEFISCISFNRIRTDWDMMTSNGKELLKLIFEKLIKEISKEKLSGIKSDSKLIQFMKFLVDSGLF